MDSIPVMSSNFDHDSFWDQSLFSAPQSGAMEFAGNYQTIPIDPMFSFDDAHAHSSNSVSDTSTGHSIEWPDSQHTWQSIESTPPAAEPKQPKMLLEPRALPQRRTRKPPSGEALERRRQQNRTAQVAFRERSKKQVDELRQELMQSVEFNQKMYSSVRQLLGRTEMLKQDMEALLAVQPPAISSEVPQNSRTNSMEFQTSPESTSDYPNQDEDNSITVDNETSGGVETEASPVTCIPVI